MWIGNLMLVVLNLPLIGIWVKLLQVPVPPALSRRSCCSAASACTACNNNVFDVLMTALFGVLG